MSSCTHPLEHRITEHEDGDHWYVCGLCGTEMPGDPVADRAEVEAEMEMDRDR